MSFADVDALYGTDAVSQGMSMLKKRCNKGDRSFEVLWRLARCCYEVAGRTGDRAKRKALTIEGQKYALESVDASKGEEFEPIRWAAVTTGQLTDYLGMKEKIEQGVKFKEYLDKALAMNTKESSLLHMRGRFAYSVAGLSWFERKAASIFYATPPTATYEEALADFLAAFEEQPEWIENVLYIGLCYQEKNDNANAKKYFEVARKIEPLDEAERDLIKEVNKQLSKC